MTKPGFPNLPFLDSSITSVTVPSQNPRPQSLLTVYPYRYPENLEQLYPSKDTTAYPTSLEHIYPVLDKKVRTTSSVAARSIGAKPSTPNNLLAIYSTQVYPVFNLYPAVYPHNLEEIYPALPHDSFVPTVQTPKAAPVRLVPPRVPSPAKSSPVQRAQNVEMSRGYPFIDLYPAVYPHNLACLYPSILKEVAVPKSTSVKVAQAQALSTLRKAKAVSSAPAPSPDSYPFNLDNLYPAIFGHPKPSSSSSSVTASPTTLASKAGAPITENIRLARVYPNLELYSPVYPYNLVIYPPIGATSESETIQVVQDKVVRNSPASDEDPGIVQTMVLPKRMRKTHAQLCTEVWRKTHAQLVAEVLASRPRKSHAELEAEVFPNGLPEAKVAPEVEPDTPTLSVTEAHGEEAGPATKPVLGKLAPVPVPTTGPKSAPVPAVAALRRQRSEAVMRPSPTESLPVPLPQGGGIELGRSRSMVEARTQMFERTHTRSQTGPQVPPARTLVRQKSATFERAKSLFHTPEETKSEGSQTPPLRSVPVRRVAKLDMSKFGFA